MLLRDFLPHPDVREFIQCYRVVHFNFSGVKDVPFKAYPPKPEQCLHFFLHDLFAIQKSNGRREVQPSIMFSGQRTSLVNQYHGRNFINVQIVFQPTAVFRLTGIPAYELVDQHLDAGLLFPVDMQSVLDELRNADGVPAILRIIEKFAKQLIDRKYDQPLPIDLVSNRLKHDSEQFFIADLAKQSCLSVKQFERKFIERSGINPKTYTKIIRFNKAFNLRNRYPFKTWSGIAIESGYHDYQHLVKDYNAFTGMQPSDLHLLETTSPECVLGLSKALYYMRCRRDY